MPSGIPIEHRDDLIGEVGRDLFCASTLPRMM